MSDQKEHLEDLVPVPVDSQPSGGFEEAEGWDLGEIAREGITPSRDNHDSFEGGMDALRFVMGVGKYSDANSFTYGPQDMLEIAGEGFFNDMYCPRCIKGILDQEVEDIEDIQDAELDPRLDFEKVDYEKKSYRLDSSHKEVSEAWYQCGEHPEVYISMTETEHV